MSSYRRLRTSAFKIVPVAQGPDLRGHAEGESEEVGAVWLRGGDGDEEVVRRDCFVRKVPTRPLYIFWLSRSHECRWILYGHTCDMSTMC
jgi:hypothetical protein